MEERSRVKSHLLFPQGGDAEILDGAFENGETPVAGWKPALRQRSKAFSSALLDFFRS